MRKTRSRSVAYAAVLSSSWKRASLQFTLCVLQRRALPRFTKYRRSQTVFLHLYIYACHIAVIQQPHNELSTAAFATERERVFQLYICLPYYLNMQAPNKAFHATNWSFTGFMTWDRIRVAYYLIQYSCHTKSNINSIKVLTKDKKCTIL